MILWKASSLASRFLQCPPRLPSLQRTCINVKKEQSFCVVKEYRCPCLVSICVTSFCFGKLGSGYIQTNKLVNSREKKFLSQQDMIWSETTMKDAWPMRIRMQQQQQGRSKIARSRRVIFRLGSCTANRTSYSCTEYYQDSSWHNQRC